MSNKFMAAKYTPDLERGEPRNIGIVAWVKGKVVYRFQDVGSLDFVNDAKNYERWIRHWEHLLNSPKIQVYREKPVTVNSAKFLDNVRLTSKDGFALTQAGESFDDVNKDNINDLVDFLFERIVSVTATKNESEKKPGIVQKCRAVFDEIDLGEKKLVSGYRTLFDEDGVREQVEFHYGIDGDQLLLFNRVNLASNDSVHSNNWKFQNATRLKPMNIPKQTIAIYDSHGDYDEHAGKTKLISRYASLSVDIDDHDKAVEVIGNVVASRRVA